MTSPNTPPEDHSLERPNYERRCFWLRRAITAFGLTLVGISGVGYVGVNSWVHQELPSFLETQLSKILKRQVNVGEVKSWRLTGIQLGSSSIPATSTDSDSVAIEAINVSFDPIPALFSRTFPVSVTLVKPNIYIEQDKQGQWVQTDIFTQQETGKLPINLDATVRLQEAKVVLLPQKQKIPFSTQINGFVNYNQTQPERVKYNINADIAKGKVGIKGETRIKTGQTQVKAKVEQLALAELSNLIPHKPITIFQGKFNANLQINLPSFSQIPFVIGRANIQKTKAKINQLPLPISASTSLNFEGQKIILKNTRGNYGNLTAFVSGGIDLNRGFNLKIDTNSVDLATLVKTLPVKLPVNIDGKFQTQMFLRGSLTSPILFGSILNQQKIKIAKTEFDKFQAKFAGNTSQFFLQDLRLIPVAGGDITAQGNVKLIDSKTSKINFNQAQLAFDLDANLPKPSAMIYPYGISQQLVQLGKLTAKGNIRGTLQNPQAILSWNLPDANISSVGKVSGTGEFLLAGEKITLRNTALQTDKSKITVRGEGNLAQKNWQVDINTNSLLVNPFISALGIDNTLINESIILDDGEVNLAGRFDNLDLASIKAKANLNLDVTKGKIAVNSQVNRGIIKATATARQIALKKLLPDLPLPLNVVNSHINIAGSVKQLLSLGSNTNLDSFRAVASGQLATASMTDKGTINFNGKGNFATQNWQASVKANSLPLTPVISQLQLANSQLNQPIVLNQGNVNLAGKLDNLDLANIQSIAQLNLNVGNGNVAINSKLNRGVIETQATARKIVLNKLVPDLPLSLKIIDSRLNFSHSMEQLLALDLSKMKANAAAKLAVEKGIVNTLSQLNNGRFSSNITATNVNVPRICKSISLSCPQLSNLSSKVNLAGDINPLLQGTSPVIMQTKTAFLQIDEQSLNANGKIIITPVSGKQIPWDMATELDIVANSNLEQLSSTLAPQNQPEITVDGKAKFTGKLLGKNLLSAPFASGNLKLIGDLALKDFTVDEIAFQPLLAGTVNIDLGKGIAIDLRGKNNNRERIAAQLQPCNREKCLLPYLPVSFELKHGTAEKAILLNGKRQGDSLDVQIQNFSLALLNTIPIVKEKIPGSIAGIVTGEIALNLFNLATTGNIKVASPDLGYIKAKEFAANFAYDGEIAQLSSAFLKLGKSQYDFQGSLNLNSGDLNGRMVTNSAQLQDIFTAVNLPLIEALFVNNKNTNTKNSYYGNASDVQTQPVGNPQATIFSQLRLFSQVRNQLQQLTASEQQRYFNPSNIQGSYSTEINVAGTLTNPEATFQLDGKNWLWDYQAQEVAGKFNNYPHKTTNQPTNQQLQLDRIIAKGSLKKGVVQLEPVRVNLKDALIAFQGQLALEGVSGLLKVQDLPINTIQHFTDLPMELGGNLNMQANLDGSLLNPQVPQGQVSLVNGTIDQQPIGEFAGQFTYLDSNFKFNTTPNSSIQLQALIPYPPQGDGNDSVLIDTKFGTKLFALLKPLTQGQLEWVKGDGEVEFKLAGPLNWQAKTAPELIKHTSINSTIQIENATVKTKQLGENIDLSLAGNLALGNDTIQVEKLEGNVAGSPFLVTGVLPLFHPISETPNPLTVTMGPGELDIKGLYKGKVNGNVIISETVMNPVIGGKVRLHDGRVFLPKWSNDQVAVQGRSDKTQVQSANNNSPIIPRFQDFQVILDDRFQFKQSLPQSDFRFTGKLTLNGLLNELQPQGTIELQRGKINLFDNQFVLTRTHDQTIEFVPEQGLLNPKINIQLRTLILDASQFERRQPIDAEIRDDIVSPANPNRIEVRVTVGGNANQLLSTLDPSISPCQLQQANTFSPTTVETVSKISPQALQEIADCIHHSAEVGIKQRQWLINPAIQVTSTPERNKAEIMALLSNRAIGSVLDIQKKISEGNGAELLSSGVIQYLTGNLIANAEREIFWKMQQPFDAAGKKIGLTHFQIIPSVQGVKHIDANSSLRFVYDYSNFFYQSILSGNNNDGFDSQFRVMYERRF